MDLMPEMVSFLVSQHQMPKFCIKHGKFHKETIHIRPSLHTSLSVLIEDFPYNPRITEINSFIDAKPACEISIYSQISQVVIGDRRHSDTSVVTASSSYLFLFSYKNVHATVENSVYI